MNGRLAATTVGARLGRGRRPAGLGRQLAFCERRSAVRAPTEKDSPMRRCPAEMRSGLHITAGALGVFVWSHNGQGSIDISQTCCCTRTAQLGAGLGCSGADCRSRRKDSRGRCSALSQNARVPGGNSQQCQGWSFRTSATLFPVTQRVHTDPECCRELLLSEPNKSAERNDILTASEASSKDPFALSPWDCSREVFVGELCDRGGFACFLHNVEISCACNNSICVSKASLVIGLQIAQPGQGDGSSTRV